MNPNRKLPGILAAFAVILCFALLLGSPSFAHAGSDGSAPVLFANFIFEFAANRTRMIQASTVFVLVACSLLWWRR